MSAVISLGFNLICCDAIYGTSIVHNFRSKFRYSGNKNIDFQMHDLQFQIKIFPHIAYLTLKITETLMLIDTNEHEHKLL